jgi:hypothetical protein
MNWKGCGKEEAQNILQHNTSDWSQGENLCLYIFEAAPL